MKWTISKARKEIEEEFPETWPIDKIYQSNDFKNHFYVLSRNMAYKLSLFVDMSCGSKIHSYNLLDPMEIGFLESDSKRELAARKLYVFWVENKRGKNLLNDYIEKRVDVNQYDSPRTKNRRKTILAPTHDLETRAGVIVQGDYVAGDKTSMERSALDQSITAHDSVITSPHRKKLEFLEGIRDDLPKETYLQLKQKYAKK